MTDCGCTNFPASLGNVTFGASVGIGTDSPVTAPLMVQGTGANPVASVGVVADHSGASTDRVRLALGNTNAGTAQGATSRSTELMFYGCTPDGSAVQPMFELGTDAEQTGTLSLFVYDDVARAYRLYLGPTGNLGIGTTSPAQKLAVQGNVSLADGTGTLFLSPTNASPPSTPALRVTDTGATGLAVSANPLRLNWDAPPGSPIYLTNGASNIVVTVAVSGNVGVGTSSPGQKLTVENAGDFSVQWVNSGSGGASWSLSNLAGAGNAGGFRFFNDSTAQEALRITNAGNVGIGTPSPTNALEVGVGGALRIAGASGPSATAYFSFGGNGVFGIDANGLPNGRFVVTDGGNVGIGAPNPAYPLDVAGTVHTGGACLAGSRTVADQQGCYYA